MKFEVVRMGCDFFDDANPKSDVNNYRLYAIEPIENIPIWLELSGGHIEPVKRVKELNLISDNPLWCSGQYVKNTEEKNIYGFSYIDYGTYGTHYDTCEKYEYTKKDIFRFISELTGKVYDEWVEVKRPENLSNYALYKEYEEKLKNISSDSIDKAESERQKTLFKE